MPVWPLSPGGHHAVSGHSLKILSPKSGPSAAVVSNCLGRKFRQKCEGNFSSPPSALLGVGLEVACCAPFPCCGALSYSMHGFPRRPPSVSDCPQGIPRSSCPSALGWHCCFARAPCRDSPTWAGCCWDWRCPHSRPLCLSSSSTALKLPGKGAPAL